MLRLEAMKRKFLAPFCVDPGPKRTVMEAAPGYLVVQQAKPWIHPPSPQLSKIEHKTAEPENDGDIYFKCMYAAKKRNSKGKGPWSDGLLLVKDGRICEVKSVGGRSISKKDFVGESKPATEEGSSFQVMRIATSLVFRLCFCCVCAIKIIFVVSCSSEFHNLAMQYLPSDLAGAANICIADLQLMDRCYGKGGQGGFSKGNNVQQIFGSRNKEETCI